jgi:hypothetical protein
MYAQASVLEGEEAGYDHGGRHGGQHAAQHQGPQPGQPQQPVGHSSHHTRLGQARHKCQPEETKVLVQGRIHQKISVADPGFSAFLTPASWMGKKSGSGIPG